MKSKILDAHSEVVAKKTTTDASNPLDPFYLTEEQIQFYDDNGFLILRDWIPSDLLKRLQDAGDHWIEKGLECNQEQNEQEPQKSDFEKGIDFIFAKRENKEVFFRVNYLFDKQEKAALELLGSPQVLAVAESMCGRNFVPTYESMVFKMAGDGETVKWHQDATFPDKNFRVFNYDVYLDHSTRDGGALRVVPKTHKKVQDPCNTENDYGWDHPDITIVEMKPGDVLLHDTMVLHGSPRVEGKALRRTIYYEFRSVEQIQTHGPWDQEWIDRRLKLVPLGLKRYQERFPDKPQFKWNIDPAYHPTISDEATELKVLHAGKHSPGTFCSATSV